MPFTIRQTKIRQFYRTFTHDFKEELDIITGQYEYLGELIKTDLNASFFAELQNYEEVLKLQLNQARNKVNNILPSKRTKRRLLNGLGNVIKSITGNVDAADAGK